MDKFLKILVVGDELIITASISLQLEDMGCEVTGIVSRGKDALVHLKNCTPDILLIDIQLKGRLDGIETVQLMQEDQDIPVIYLTTNADDINFNRAKATHPYGFIARPFKRQDLQRAIELTAMRLQMGSMRKAEYIEPKSPSFILSESIFIRCREKMVKVGIKDILYIEADRNYCRIYSIHKEYLLVMTLKDMEEKLPPQHFLRVHRSYIINLSQIDEVGSRHVVLSRKAIPISKLLKPDLIKRLQTV